MRVIKGRRLRWADHVARMEEGRNNLNILTGKRTGKRPSGRSKRRWEDIIKEEYGLRKGIIGERL